MLDVWFKLKETVKNTPLYESVLTAVILIIWVRFNILGIKKGVSRDNPYCLGYEGSRGRKLRFTTSVME